MLKLKRYQKLLALALCLVTLFSASAAALAPNENGLLSVAVVDFFAEQGVEISRTASIELVPIEHTVTDAAKIKTRGAASAADTSSGYAVRVKEVNGNEVKEHNFLFLKEDEDGTYMPDVELAMAVAGGTYVSSTSDIPNITIYATGTYNAFTKQGEGVLEQPISLLWSYSGSGNPSYISVSYGTKGWRYSLPDLTKVGEGYYTHTITYAASSPSQNTPYENTHNPSSYAINPVGDPPRGMTFIATIGGKSYEIVN